MQGNHSRGSLLCVKQQHPTTASHHITCRYLKYELHLLCSAGLQDIVQQSEPFGIQKHVSVEKHESERRKAFGHVFNGVGSIG